MLWVTIGSFSKLQAYPCYVFAIEMEKKGKQVYCYYFAKEQEFLCQNCEESLESTAGYVANMWP